MNGRMAESHAYTQAMSQAVREKPPSCHVAICPPAPLLISLREGLAGSGIMLGAQDCHAANDGAHTGGISAAMLADVGAKLVIIGHSERRAEGEGGALIAAKLAQVWQAGLVPLLCVGEEEGQGVEKVMRQLKESLSAPPEGESRPLVIGYEPVWAIGSGKTPTTEEITTTHRHIAAMLAEQGYGGAPILYGGSVNPDNAGDILAAPNVAGALVGGASLKPETFLAIIQQAPAK